MNLERWLVGVFDRTVSYTVRSCNSIPHTFNRDDSTVAKVVIRSLPSTVREDPVDRDPERGPHLPFLPPPFLYLYILSSIYLYHPTSKMEDLETYQTPLARSDPHFSQPERCFYARSIELKIVADMRARRWRTSFPPLSAFPPSPVT